MPSFVENTLLEKMENRSVSGLKKASEWPHLKVMIEIDRRFRSFESYYTSAYRKLVKLETQLASWKEVENE